MPSIHFSSWRKQCQGLSTSNFIIVRMTTVSMLLDCIIPRLTTMTVIYPRHWLCLPALHCAMLSWSGKRTKVFIRKLPSQSRKQTDLVARATLTTSKMVVRTHPAALRMSLTSPGIADTYKLLMNTCNTLPGSYQQRLYKNTLATVKHHI